MVTSKNIEQSYWELAVSDRKLYELQKQWLFSDISFNSEIRDTKNQLETFSDRRKDSAITWAACPESPDNLVPCPHVILGDDQTLHENLCDSTTCCFFAGEGGAADRCLANPAYGRSWNLIFIPIKLLHYNSDAISIESLIKTFYEILRIINTEMNSGTFSLWNEWSDGGRHGEFSRHNCLYNWGRDCFHSRQNNFSRTISYHTMSRRVSTLAVGR